MIRLPGSGTSAGCSGLGASTQVYHNPRKWFCVEAWDRNEVATAAEMTSGQPRASRLHWFSVSPDTCALQQPAGWPAVGYRDIMSPSFHVISCTICFCLDYTISVSGPVLSAICLKPSGLGNVVA